MSSVVWSCVKLLLIGAVLAFGGVLYYYVSTKETLEFRAGVMDWYVKNKLSKFFTDVDVRDVQLSWRRADENFFLSVKGVTVVDEKLGLKVEIPEVSIYSKVGILFLWGDWGASRIDLPKVHLSVFNSDNTAKTSYSSFSIASLREKLLVLVRSNVPVKIGGLLLSNQEGESLELDFVYFGTEKEYDGSVFNLEFAGNVSFVKVQLSEHYRGVVSLHAKYDNLDTKLLAYMGILDSRLTLYSGMLLSGTADVVIDAHDQIEYGDLNLKSLKGVLPYGSDEELVVRDFRARVRYSDHRLVITDFNLFIDDFGLKMRASLDYISGRLDVNVGGYEIAAKRVCTYWPKQLYPDLKLWYCDHIAEGIFREPQVDFHGSISDWGNVANYRLSSHIKDASIRINDEWGVVNIVDGGLLLDKKDLTIRSGNYNFRGINAADGIAIIKNVNSSGTKLEIRGTAVSKAKELYEAAAAKQFLGLKADSISGSATTKFWVEVLNLSGEEAVRSKTRVESKVRDLSVNKVLNSFDLSNANLHFVIDDGSIEASVDAVMNEHAMNLVATGNLNSRKGISCKFSGYVSGKNIQELKAIARTIGLEGSAKADIEWVNYLGAGNDKILGTLDVTTVYSGEGFFSAGEEKRILKFAATVGKDGPTLIDYVTITGKDVDVLVRGQINNGDLDLVVDKVKFLKTDAKAAIKSQDGGFVLNLDGDFLDISKANLGVLLRDNSDNTPYAHSNIQVRLGKVLMKNDVLMKDLNFNLTSENKGSTGAKVSGYFANDNTAVSVEYGSRGLEVVAGNAGDFLRAIGVMNTVDGGSLSIYMYPEDHQGGAHGVFSMTKFNVVNAPILAQILTLSSLQGISNTLRGSGINFGKLNVPFRYSNNLIRFEESWIEGIELGISVGGKMSLSTKSFDVRGQIVPAYALNKMIWCTPLFGKLLTGGQSRGIIAVDYKVRGTAKVHDISVNLLSILAPTLLKRVLKVWDDKALQQEDSAA